MMDSPMGFNFMFTLVPMIIAVGFIFVFGMILYSIITGVKQWDKNNHSPLLTVDATIVTKRADVSTHHHTSEEHMSTSTSTTYYVTFQVESGDRMEFQVMDQEYGLLVEGDQGKLSFQGTRYKGFSRIAIGR